MPDPETVRCISRDCVSPLAVPSGCGSSGEAETTSEVERPSADPPVYHQTAYDLETGWVQVASDEKVGDYLQGRRRQ